MSDAEHILYLQQQVERFAAKPNHQHSVNDITDLSTIPENHSDTTNKYGAATEDKYGHVRLNATITEETEENPLAINNHPATSRAVQIYVKNKIANFGTNLKNTYKILDSTFSILKSTTGISSSSTDSQIPTAKAVWNAIKGYDDTALTGISLAKPASTDKTLNQLREPGYYKEKKVYYFTYGGEKIYYANGLIKVEKQSNRVIQHVYSTTKIKTSDGEYVYKLNGAEYTRWGTSENDWRAWHCAHKPYTKTSRATNWGDGVDSGSVVVYENTAGFIIHWDQTKQEDDKYPVSAPLYSYKRVCSFEPALPIKGPYVFGNLIGRCDFKITSDKLEIRTNVPAGGRIIGMHETFFVPRNQ